MSFILLFALSLSFSSLYAQPKAVTHLQSIDLGDVYSGDWVRQSFRIENRGDADLTLESRQPT